MRRRSKRYRGKKYPERILNEINMTQGMVDGFSLEKYQHAKVKIVGAGGLGSPIAYGLMRKGVRHLEIYDDDHAEYSNLTRQLYAVADVGKYKVHALGKAIAKNNLFPITVVAYPFRFQELHHNYSHATDDTDLIVAAVDNNVTRADIARYGKRHGIPIIHVAVGRDANAITVMAQEPNDEAPCWGCAYPENLNNRTYPCAVPGIVDTVTVAAGHVLHAADTLICNRPRHWDRRDVFLDGALPDRTRTIERNPKCPICAPGVYRQQRLGEYNPFVYLDFIEGRSWLGNIVPFKAFKEARDAD